MGTRDFFDIQGSWDTFREVKLLYGRLGFGERVDLFESDEPHGSPKPRRVATVRWMRRWLLKIDDAITEADSPIAPDQDLQCTRTGQVLGDGPGVSVFDLNADGAQFRERRALAGGPAFHTHDRIRMRQLLGCRRRNPTCGGSRLSARRCIMAIVLASS